MQFSVRFFPLFHFELEMFDDRLKLRLGEMVVRPLKTFAVQILNEFKVRVIGRGVHAVAHFQIVQHL